MSRIVEGSTVLVTQTKGDRTYRLEALACGSVEDGEVLVRFTTRGTEHAYAASRVEWVADPW